MDEQPQAVMEITLLSDGRIHIAGPIDNKILAYGMLEAARKALDDYVPNDRPSIVMVPPRFNGKVG